MAAAGDIVYLSRPDGVHVIDTSVADSPRQLAIYPAPESCSESCYLALADGTLYYQGPVGFDPAGPTWLHVIDVSNPAMPSLIAAASLTGVTGRSIAVPGGLLAVMGSSDLYLLGRQSAPPSLVGTLAIRRQNPDAFLALTGSRLFIANGSLTELDITQPAAPELVGTLDNRNAGSAWIGVDQIALDGDVGWIPVGEYGIQKLDLRTVGQPRIVSMWRPSPPRYLNAVAWKDGHLHAAGSSPGGGPQGYLRLRTDLAS
jgi:hypothetical protein